MENLTPEDQAMLDAIVGRRPGSPIERGLRKDILAMRQTISAESADLPSSLSETERDARRERMRQALIAAKLLEPGDGSVPVVSTSTRDSAFQQPPAGAALANWARGFEMSVEKAISSLRALLESQVFPPPLGAASTNAKGVLRVLPKAGCYSLTVSQALDDPNVFFLLVKIEEQMLALSKGRSIVVRMGATEYPIGPIGDDGIAEAEIMGPLTEGQSLEVIISSLPSDPSTGI